MDSPILLLENTDQATKQMLENVRKRKVKFDKLKKRHNLFIMATLSEIALFFAYLYYTVIKPDSYSFAAMFSAFVRHSLNLYLLALTVGMYGYMDVLRKQREKKEKEYHELRCEIVDRSKDLWKKEEDWANRHLVFEMMKNKYDINLYHEKK
ncbi:MAG: YpbF family protein [Bacillota bacterium]|nr:YpbF family protein [Bacillota bacterium]